MPHRYANFINKVVAHKPAVMGLDLWGLAPEAKAIRFGILAWDALRVLPLLLFPVLSLGLVRLFYR